MPIGWRLSFVPSAILTRGPRAQPIGVSIVGYQPLFSYHDDRRIGVATHY